MELEDIHNNIRNACAVGHFDVVEVLCTKDNIDINAGNDEYGNTPNHLAFAGGYSEIVDFLCKQVKIDLVVKNNEEKLFLMCLPIFLKNTLFLMKLTSLKNLMKLENLINLHYICRY